METENKHYLMLSVKTLRGYKYFGEFYLGNDSKRANDIFNGLKGRDPVYADTVLHIDMIVIAGDQPETAKSIACTLNEFVINSKYISKEIFRINNLELS